MLSGKKRTVSGYPAEAAEPVPSRTRERVAPQPEISVELNDVQSALEAKLKNWRQEQARLAGLPSFFIFSDTVLRSIVLTRPQTVGELCEVRGVGPEKVGRFGTAVVELCRA